MLWKPTFDVVVRSLPTYAILVRHMHVSGADSTCVDSTDTRTSADSRCRRSCAGSSVTSPTATCADSTCPRNCADSPKLPVQIPEHVQVLHDPEPMQIPDVPQPIVQIPQSSTLWSRQMHSTSSCRSYLNPQTKNSRCFTRYPPILLNISSHSWMNLKGGVSDSKYGGLPFGSHALNAAGGRVRDLVDVVGRLGNASRREPTLACGVSPTLETGFGNTCGTLALERFGPLDAFCRHAP
ncbi:hypothetical protein TNCV_1699301 [Trichonephila clavipes]|nr:hypothetical protein TNCV_1699301 [Trichonephila clavipes]